MAIKKNEKPAVKITGKGSSSPRTGSGTGNKSLKPGGMNQASKIVRDKKAAPKKMTPAMKAKIDKAISKSGGASLRLELVKEAIKLGNVKPATYAARMLKRANQRDLDTGRTASRAKNIASRYNKKSK